MRSLILLLLMPVALALELSEVFPDPAGDDNGREFIELIGSENLTGCTVSDSASTDALVLVKAGNEVILIVEEDGIYNDTPGATIYHAGRAIGNGLGNTADSITVACGETLINASYDVSSANGYAPGKSLVWKNGWEAGDPTPGVALQEAPEDTNAADIPPVPPAEPEVRSGGRPCNTTLAITMSADRGYEGDEVLFTVVSDGYAGFMAEAGGEVFLEGDTLTRREYALALPEGDVRITATARQCDARQRATRMIRVLPRVEPSIANESEVVQEVSATVETVQAENLTAPAAEPTQEVPPITANVVYDQDRNVVPWVSAFGIVTLAVSAWLFKGLKENGN